MYHCPHCHEPITNAELLSGRFLTLRKCPTCCGEYFEGGAVQSIASISGAAALAYALKSWPQFPPWGVWLVLGSGIVAAILITQKSPLRRGAELKKQQFLAVVTGPLVALAVWAVVGLAS
jgi:hypothetical protein